MQIGKAKQYTVEGVVFSISPKWGPRKDYKAAVAALPEAVAGGYHDYNTAVEKLGLDILDQVILGIEGLTGEDGEPITEWSRDIAYELDEAFVDDLLTRIVRNESDERLGNLPETLESSPETTSEDVL